MSRKPLDWSAVVTTVSSVWVGSISKRSWDNKLFKLALISSKEDIYNACKFAQIHRNSRVSIHANEYRDIPSSETIWGIMLPGQA